MTCTLILMRHSYAADGHCCRDFERKLTGTGVGLAKATGKLMNERNITPDLIVTSAATRTVQTSECVAEQFESNIRLVLRPDLYQAGPSAYLPAIQSEAAPNTTTILSIGHNPAIESMISGLAGQRLSVSPATAGVFSIDAEDWFDLPSLNSQTAKFIQLIVGAKLSRDL